MTTVLDRSGCMVPCRSSMGKSRQRYVSRHRIHRSERRWHGQRFFGLQGPNWVDVGLQPCSGRHKTRAGFVWSLKKSNFWSAHCRPANSRPGKVTHFRGKEIRRSAYKSAIYAKSGVAIRTFAGIYPEIAQQLGNFISSNNITATVAADENQLILSDPSNFRPPLKITRGGNGLFHLKDTQDGFQRQVYVEMARWNGDKSFTQSETLAEGEKWLTRLRRG